MEGIGVPAGGSTGRRPLASLNCSARESSREEKSSALIGADDFALPTYWRELSSTPVRTASEVNKMAAIIVART